MRIRNRKVPFPLSSLSPVPLSDPPFSDLLHRSTSQRDRNPSDQRSNCIGDGAGCHNSSEQHQNKLVCTDGGDQDVDPNGGAKAGEKVSNHRRKATIWGAKTLITPLHQENSKKRKSNGEIEITKEKKMKSNASKNGVKKRGRGGAVMEGSRCSRVNGRGWRCCQPTLVGYSLCEHHLGKGRLRSMTSVPDTKVEPMPRPVSIEGEEMVNGDETVLVPKRKHKIGMVKARSMSSLLSQADRAITSVADNEISEE